jgi:putative peptidoglycan lipid II flippase
LTASAGVAGWIEFALLRRSLNRRIGRTGLTTSYITKLWTGALAGAALGWGIKLVLPHLHPIVTAGLVLVPYGLLYFGVTAAFGVEESVANLRRGLRIIRVRR